MQPAYTNTKPGISVLIPVYNSAEILGDVVDNLMPVLKNSGQDHEVILVNDGSRDNSWDVIEAASAKHEQVRGINLMRNYGQHNAVLCAIRSAQYDVCVTMDDDGQHPPEHVITLLEKLNEGGDVVYGTPQKEQHGVLRDMASRITKIALQHAMGAETAEKVSALRAFKTRIRNAFENYSSPFVSIDVLLTWGTTNFTAVTLEHRARTSGVSNYSFRKLLTHALNMMTGFTILPLQLATWSGFLFTLFGLLILLFVISRYLIQGDVVPGFAFLASIIAIFSGAQLFALGIFGEYLARMHFRIMDKPEYTIRETCGSSHS